MTTITGILENAAGEVLHARIDFISKSTPLVGAGVITANTDKSIKTNPETGEFSIQLVAGNYRVEINADGLSTSFDIAVPEGSDTLSIEEITSTPLTFTFAAPNTVWNGVRPGQITFDPIDDPPAPTAQAITVSPGIGHQTGESASYKVVWIDADQNHTLPSDPVSQAVVGPNNAIRVFLPTAPSGVTNAYVYRVALDGNYYLHTTVSALTTLIDDGLSSAQWESFLNTDQIAPVYNNTAGQIIPVIAGDAQIIFSNEGLVIPGGAGDGKVLTSDRYGFATWQSTPAVNAVDAKESVRVATTANVAHSGLLTIDGVTLVDGNRVLDKDNSTAANRGIWIAHSGAWIRAVDADSDADVTSGLFVFVEEGTVNADKGFILTTHNPITLGSTGLTFSQFNVNPGGTVTSIAATVPSWLSISGSPITSSGTLAITAASGQTANRVLATPDSSTGAVTLRQIVSGDISGPLTVAVGGTNASTARAVGANVGIYQLSAGGGGSGEGDYSGKTPAFEGQLGVAYYGGKAPFFYFSGSTTTSDWKHEFNFPTGVKQVGSVGTMADVDGTHGMYRLDFHFNGSTIGYQTQSDDGIWVRTWSIHTNNSGASIGHVVTGGDDGSGKATIIDLVGSSFTYVPANRIASVIPGNSLLIFNSDSTNLKGLAIASTNCTGAFGGGAAGNYSLAYFDFKNGLFRVPRFVASKFQPDDSGWLDSFTVNPSTGAVAVGASGSFTTGASTSITMQPVASTGISISSAGNVTVCANNANTGTSSWSRVIVNTDAAAASPGVTVGINGGGHGVYCSTDGLTIGITNCGSSAAKWYDGGAGANTSKGNYSHTPTWNSSGTTFTGHLFNVTNTASAAGSLIFDWQIGGTSVLKLSKASVLTMTGSLTVTAAITGAIFIGSTATISASDIDWTVAEYRYKTLGANTTLTFSNVTEGETIYVGITNTASNWTLTWPAMSWVGGITPVQTIGAKTDWYAIWRVNGITWGSYLQGY